MRTLLLTSCVSTGTRFGVAETHLLPCEYTGLLKYTMQGWNISVFLKMP